VYCDALAADGVYLMPGTIFERPQHFRISLTATMDMIEKALPRLVAAAPSP
jgi:aspartate aminotransferase